MQASSVRVLLIEGNDEDARLARQALADSEAPAFQVVRAIRLEAAVRHLQDGGFGVVVLDPALPDASPLSAVQQLVALKLDAPIVVWTHREDEKLFGELMRSGARDCVVKERQAPAVLTRTVRYALERHHAVTNNNVVAPAQAAKTDYDPVVGLPLRKVFNNWLQQAVDTAAATNQQFVVMLASLDRFRAIQDTLGQPASDDLLRTAAGRISPRLAPSARMVRLAGSDFGIILPDTVSRGEAAGIAHRLVDGLSQPYTIDGRELYAGASIGIVVREEAGQDTTQLLRQADLAMQKAKDAGGNTYQFYSSRIRQAEARSLALESGLRQALDRDELVLYFQPCIELASGRVISVEALARWPQPELGLVPPGDFIPLAEQAGIIFKLDAWALRAACQQVRHWRASEEGAVSVAVNLSSRQFEQAGSVGLVEDILKTTGLAAAQLELEITETALMRNPERAATALARLKSMGVKTAVDDFGVGYSSLNYLRSLPVDILKIDQSFIRELGDDPKNAALVESIISLAKTLGLTVVAEGVETRDQLRWLIEHGCDRVQGFLFSPAVPRCDLAEMTSVARQILQDVTPRGG